MHDDLNRPVPSAPTSPKIRWLAFVATALAVLLAVSMGDYAGAAVWSLFGVLFTVVYPAAARRPVQRHWQVLSTGLTVLIVIAALWRLAIALQLVPR